MCKNAIDNMDCEVICQQEVGLAYTQCGSAENKSDYEKWLNGLSEAKRAFVKWGWAGTDNLSTPKKYLGAFNKHVIKKSGTEFDAVFGRIYKEHPSELYRLCVNAKGYDNESARLACNLILSYNMRDVHVTSFQTVKKTQEGVCFKTLSDNGLPFVNILCAILDAPDTSNNDLAITFSLTENLLTRRKGKLSDHGINFIIVRDMVALRLKNEYSASCCSVARYLKHEHGEQECLGRSIANFAEELNGVWANEASYAGSAVQHLLLQLMSMKVLTSADRNNKEHFSGKGSTDPFDGEDIYTAIAEMLCKLISESIATDDIGYFDKYIETMPEKDEKPSLACFLIPIRRSRELLEQIEVNTIHNIGKMVLEGVVWIDYARPQKPCARLFPCSDNPDTQLTREQIKKFCINTTEAEISIVEQILFSIQTIVDTGAVDSLVNQLGAMLSNLFDCKSITLSQWGNTKAYLSSILSFYYLNNDGNDIAADFHKYQQAIYAEHYALQICIDAEERTIARYKGGIVRIVALTRQFELQQDALSDDELLMDFLVPAWLEVASIPPKDNVINNIKEELARGLGDLQKLYDHAKKHAIVSIPNSPLMLTHEFVVESRECITDLQKKTIEKIKVHTRDNKRQPTDLNCCDCYLAELDSALMKEPAYANKAEARMMEQLLHNDNNIVLSLPQLVDSPLRHLAKNPGFTLLMKFGKISVSLYNDFYDLLQYAATQIEQNPQFTWSSIPEINSFTSEQRKQTAAFLRGGLSRRALLHYKKIRCYSEISAMKDELTVLNCFLPFQQKRTHYQHGTDILYASALDVAFKSIPGKVERASLSKWNNKILKALQIPDAHGNSISYEKITRSTYRNMLKLFETPLRLSAEQRAILDQSFQLGEDVQKATDSISFLADDTYNRLIADQFSDRQIFKYPQSKKDLVPYRADIPEKAGGVKPYYVSFDDRAPDGLEWDQVAMLLWEYHNIKKAGTTISFSEYLRSKAEAYIQNIETDESSICIRLNDGAVFCVSRTPDDSNATEFYTETAGFIVRSPSWKRYLDLKGQCSSNFARRSPDGLQDSLETERRWLQSLGREPNEDDYLGVIEEHPTWLYVREVASAEDGTLAASKRVIYLDTSTEQRIAGYLDLIESGAVPVQAFGGEDPYAICVDPYKMLKYEEACEKYGDRDGKVGLILKNGSWQYIIRDLFQRKDKTYGTYLRVIPQAGGGAVILPRWTNTAPNSEKNGEVRFGLLDIFRFSTRQVELEAPRGFKDFCTLIGVPEASEDCAIRELGEELNLSGITYRMFFLGKTHPDSGLTSSEVSVYLADIKSDTEPMASVGHEAIRGVRWEKEDRFIEMLSENLGADKTSDSETPKIRCGFTQTAYLLYKLSPYGK